MIRILIVFLLFVGVGLADRDEHKRHFPRDLHELDLNKDQKKEFYHLLKKYHKIRKKHEDKEEDFEDYLEEAFSNDNFNEEEFKEKKLKLYNRAIELEAKILKEIHSILTKEQREEFSEYLEEWEID